MVDKSEKVVWGARLGFMVRGLVYALFGYMALTTTNRDQAAAGTQGSLEFLQEIPGGTPILFVCTIGLLGYGLYKLIAAILDTERMGTDIEGIGRRVGWVASAIFYGLMAWTALQLAMGSKNDAGGQTQDLAHQTLSFEFGAWALGLAGIALLVGAADQFRRAWTGSFMQHIASGAPRFTCYLGQAGHAARGIVLLLVGWSLIKSAWGGDSNQVRSLGQALLDMQSMGLLFTLVALGLILFGFFSMITARYRIIPDPDRTPGR